MTNQSGRSCVVPCGQADRSDVSHSLYSLSKLVWISDTGSFNN